MNSRQQTATIYDVIGDVHGHHEKLTALLTKLGYSQVAGIWGQPGHQAVFVGDLIDKGPKPAKVLDTVQKMVEAAIAILKNAGIERLCDKALAGYRDAYSDIYLAMDRVIAGCAHQFPAHLANGRKFRSIRFRFQWWPEDKVAINPIEGDVARINLSAPDSTKPPVFFGHYALTGTPNTLGTNVASVDYSVAYGGPLTAYQHTAGQPLKAEYFVT